MPRIDLEIFQDLTPLENGLEKTVAQLRTASKELGNDMATAFKKADVQANKLDADLKKEVADLKEIEKQLNKNNKAVGQKSKDLKSVNKEVSVLQTGFAKLGPLVAATFSIGAISAFVGKIISVRSEFEKFEAVLTNSLGSKSVAQTALRQLQQIAAETPFSVAELTESYVKLVNQGFEPTREQIIALGDLAASTGKQFDQLTEAIIDAQTGEFERLKEFGIRASKEGANVTFTFKGVQTQTEFTNQSIRDYILSLGELEGVSGSMAAISKTLGGQISNLGDNFDALFNNLGKLSSGQTGGVLSFINGALSDLNKNLDETNQVSATLGDTSENVDELSTSLKKLGLLAAIPGVGGIASLFVSNDLNEELLQFQRTLNGITSDLAGFSTKSEFIPVLEKLQTELTLLNFAYESGEIDLSAYNAQLKLLGASVNAVNEQTKHLNETQTKNAALANEESVEQKKARLSQEKKDAKERLKLLEDYAKAQEDLRKRVQAAQLENLTGEERIKRELKYEEEELDLLKKHFIEVGKLTNSNFKLSVEQEKQFGIIRNEARINALDRLIEIEKEAQQKLKAEALATANTSLGNLGLQQDINLASVDATTNPGLSEEEFTKQKEIRKLEIKRNYVNQTLELQLAAIEAEKQLDENASEDQQERLRLEGEKLRIESVNTLNGLQDDIDNFNKKSEPLNFAKLLGVDKEALNSLKGSLLELSNAFSEMIQNKITQNESVISSSENKQRSYENEINSLKNKLNNENELNKQGRANNKSLIDQQILDLQAKQAQEKLIQSKAFEEKKRLQKQQLLLDSVTQASNLITSATNIFLQATATAGPAGVPVAIAAIAAMGIAFAASKLAAYKAINESPQGFEKGGYTGDKGTKEVAGVVHGKEFVHTADATKKHRDLFESIHSGNEKQYRAALIRELQGTGVSLDHGLPSRINSGKRAINQQKISESRVDNSVMEQELKIINTKFDKVIKNQTEKTYTDHLGNTVIQKGNNKTIIKKR